LQSYLHIFGFLDDFHFGASLGTFTGVLELSLEFPVDMEYVKGVFSISLEMQLQFYILDSWWSSVLLEMWRVMDCVAEDWASMLLYLASGMGMPTRTEPKINKWAKRDERTTNGQTDKWTNGRASKLDSTGALITVMASGTLYRYKSTDTDTVSEFVSPFVSVSLCSLRCSCFWPQKEGVAHRGWDSADSLCYLLLPFDWLTSIADENFMQIYYFKSHFSH